MSGDNRSHARFRLGRRPIAPIPELVRARLRAAIALSVVTGAVTGLIVAGVHEIIVRRTWGLLELRDHWWLVVLPAGALALSTAILMLTRERSTETTEEYIRAFHDPAGRIRTTSVPAKLLASIATLALGGSLGLEGPSIYAGAAVGDAIERRTRKFLLDEDRKVLLVAGAAAGIAAIFKAPLTGLVFALEVPYRDELARRALIPAMFAAAAGYVTFVSVAGTEPLFPIAAVSFRLADFGVSLVVGLACGIGARLFVTSLRTASRTLRRIPFTTRWIAAALVVAACGVASLALFHRPWALGPGYEAIRRASRGQIAVWPLLALFGLKLVATSATAGGNGVGGLFFPSVLMGATVGGVVGHWLPGPPSLFAVVGIAAFLGGAYKVPLAGVAFVAETTGAPGYIIPGLLAAAIAYLSSGRVSVSHRQRYRRIIDLDTRMDVPVSEIMTREWVEVPVTATLTEVANHYAIKAKARLLPVVDDGRFAGMAALSALGDIPSDQWPTTPVTAIVRDGHPVLSPEEKLRDALRAMRAANVDRAPVLRQARLQGLIQTTDVLQLERILDTLDEEGRRS